MTTPTEPLNETDVQALIALTNMDSAVLNAERASFEEATRSGTLFQYDQRGATAPGTPYAKLYDYCKGKGLIL